MYLKDELYQLIKTDESIFDFIQEGSLDGLWYWDLENPENEWMNARFWKVLGYDPNQMPHKASAWQEIINQDDLKLATENFVKHCENPNHPYDQIVRYTHKNGSTIWIRCRGVAIRDKAGKAIRMLGAHQDISEMKRREEELAKANEKAFENEEKYRAFFNNSPLSYQSLDESGCFIDINPMWYQTLGYERDEVIGKWFGDFLHPDFIEHFRTNFPEFVKRGYISDVQFKLRRKDGTYIYVSFEGRVGYTQEGKFKQTYCVFKDITEQKALESAIIQAQNKAEESEILFKSVIENAPDGVVIINEQGNFKYVSPNASRLFGYNADESMGHSGDEYTHPEDLPMVLKTLESIIRDPSQKPKLEYRFKRKNGEYRWIETTFTNLLSDKTINGIVLNFTDITVRKQLFEELIIAKEKAEESERKLRNALENSPIPIGIAGVDGTIIFLNKQFTEVYGYTVKDIPLLEKWYERAYPDPHYRKVTVEEWNREVEQSIKEGKPTRVKEYQVSCKNGDIKTVAISGYFEEEIIVGLFQDITERKQVEKKLRNLSEMQSIILRMASEFINMPKVLVEDSIQHSLKELGEFVQADRAYIFEYDWTKNVCSNTFEWCKEGVSPEIDNLQDVPNEAMVSWVEAHKNGREINIVDVMKLPPDDQVRQLLEPQDIRSVLALPMMKRGQCIGFIGFDSVRKIHKYSEKEKTLLKIFSEMLVNIGNRIELEENLVQAKEKAEKSEERFNLAMQASNDGIFDWNLINNEIYYSPAWKKMLGYEEEELPNDFSVWETTTNPEDVKKSWELQRKLINKQIDRFVIEFRMKHKEGHWIDVLSQAEAVFDNRGTAVRIVGTHTDITKRKQAELALKESEQRFRSLVNTINSGVAFYKVINEGKSGSDYIIQSFNEFALKHEKLQQEDVCGKSLKDIRPGIDEYGLIDTFREVWQTGKPAFFPAKLYIDEQYSNYYENRVFKISTGEIVAVYDDVSERERALLNLKEALGKAQESDRLKSAFLANMSHEIRTPMNGILGFAELLKKPGLGGDEQQKYIEIIEKSGKRMLNIINDIVDISKIEAGLMALSMLKTNVNELIEDTCTFFKPEAETKAIRLSFKNALPGKEASIKTDREKLYAILTNLIINAIKYTPEGSIEVGYDIVKSRDASMLQFYVKDSGIGIPEDRQAAIFERFIQADIDNRMAYQGAGLGLAITKAYVEMLGGSIWVESKAGKGSIFYFTLPYDTEPTEETKERPAVVPEQNNAARKLKILIAEDDDVSEMLLDETIRFIGKEILKAKTGAEAVQVCRANPDIDLILMDIRMPGMGGYQATQQIREFNKEVVIIAQTAYGLMGDREKAIESGCDDYISKPVKRGELITMIEKHFA